MALNAPLPLDGTTAEAALATHSGECARRHPRLWGWEPPQPAPLDARAPAGDAPDAAAPGEDTQRGWDLLSQQLAEATQLVPATEGSPADEAPEGDSAAEPPEATLESPPAHEPLAQAAWIAAYREAMEEVDALAEAEHYLPTLRNVPRPATAGWADAVQALSDEVRSNQADEDAWRNLELLSRLILWAPTRQRGRALPPADKAAVVLRRLARLFAGDAAGLLADAQRAAQEHAQLSRRAPPPDPDEPTAVAEAVCRLAAAGNAGRAFRLYQSPGMAPRTPQTAAALQQRYLATEVGERRPPCPPPPPGTELLSDFNIGPVLRRMSRGGGADVLGWRAEHLQALLGRTACLTSLRGVFELELTAQVPAAAASALLTSRMLALRKGDNGFRPIGAPGVFRNLAERVACARYRGAIAEAVGTRQHGVSRAAGLEQAIHRARAMADARPQLVWLSLDARNAFNS